MTAIAQAERYASRFMPWFFDGRRVYWGWATDTRSQAMDIAHALPLPSTSSPHYD